MLGELGSPEKAYRIAHVAGTNGKGSTCAMIASIMREAGCRAGLYTSPALVDVNERIDIDGRLIDDGALFDCAARVYEAEKKLGVRLSGFDRVTLSALLYYSGRCDIVVLEAGLGGRLDPTSAVTPDVSVITSIALDHTAILGDTIEKIAAEKCGILKAGVPLVCHEQPDEAMRVIEARAAALGCPLYVARPTGEYRPLLEGDYQRQNAASAAVAARLLGADEKTIREGIAHAYIPCRMERIGNVLLDGAHNPHAARALAAQLIKTGKKYVLLAAVMRDKDIGGILEALAPVTECAVCVRINERGETAQSLKARVEAAGVAAYAEETLKDALEKARALSKGDMFVVAGSLYLAGAVRQKLMEEIV
jgi:dihydrofolate synthase/folylpolyglutamate synthase